MSKLLHLFWVACAVFVLGTSPVFAAEKSVRKADDTGVLSRVEQLENTVKNMWDGSGAKKAVDDMLGRMEKYTNQAAEHEAVQKKLKADVEELRASVNDMLTRMETYTNQSAERKAVQKDLTSDADKVMAELKAEFAAVKAAAAADKQKMEAELTKIREAADAQIKTLQAEIEKLKNKIK